MKRLLSFVLAAIMVCGLCIVANADDYTLDPYYVFHTSYDIFNGALISNLPSANEFTVEAGSDTGKFTGWTATSEEIVGFAYSVNEGDYVVKESFMQATEQAVAEPPRQSVVRTGLVLQLLFRFFPVRTLYVLL